MATPPPPPRTPWPQNTVLPPIPAQNAEVNPRLAPIKRTPLIYTFPFRYVPSILDQTFRMTFLVDLSNDFFLSNIGATAFVVGTDAAAYPVGFLTVRGKTDQYAPFEEVPLQGLSRGAGAAFPNPPNYRTILPMIWGVGAGGAFDVIVFAPASPLGVDSLDCQVTFEGWRWFDFDTVDMIDDAPIW